MLKGITVAYDDLFTYPMLNDSLGIIIRNLTLIFATVCMDF